MKKQVYLSKKQSIGSNPQNNKNIFANQCNPQNINARKSLMPQGRKPKLYDFVGSIDLRKSLGIEADEEAAVKKKRSYISEESQHQSPGQKISFLTFTRNSSIMKRKISQSDRKALRSNQRCLQKYRQIKEVWKNMSKKSGKSGKELSPSILDRTSQSLRIEQNPTKEELYKQKPHEHWHMSLRNNDKYLQRHLRGSRHSQIQLQRMLDSIKGSKRLEMEKPVLPLEQLRRRKVKEFVLTGRSKEKLQNFSIKSERRSEREREVFYRTNYDFRNKWRMES